VRMEFIRLGKPVRNAYAESFNGRLRDECLNANWFTSLNDARRTVEEWRHDYNQGQIVWRNFLTREGHERSNAKHPFVNARGGAILPWSLDPVREVNQAGFVHRKQLIGNLQPHSQTCSLRV
jgi:hypothetical protein